MGSMRACRRTQMDPPRVEDTHVEGGIEACAWEAIAATTTPVRFRESRSV